MTDKELIERAKVASCDNVWRPEYEELFIALANRISELTNNRRQKELPSPYDLDAVHDYLHKWKRY